MSGSSSHEEEEEDLTNFVVHQGNGVKGLSETGIKTLPPQYILPLEQRIDSAKVVTDQSPLVIDMSNSDQNLADSICDAAQKWGFFHVINHGVPVQVLEDVLIAAKKFFGSPAAEKLRFSRQNSPTANVRYGTNYITHGDTAVDWRDSLSLVYVSDDEVAAYWPLFCRDEAMEFLNKSDPLVKKLLSALMGRLNVNEINKEKEQLLMGSKMITMNYYPKCPNPELAAGVGRHCDFSTLTILLQDDIGGLYVRKPGGDSWVHVRPISGSLVINVGDALQIMSNGRYKSIEHRVVANGSSDRVSVPIFVDPCPDAVIGPLAEVVENGEKAVYKQVLYRDYVRHFHKKARDGDGEETANFAKI